MCVYLYVTLSRTSFSTDEREILYILYIFRTIAKTQDTSLGKVFLKLYRRLGKAWAKARAKPWATDTCKYYQN